MPSGTLAISLRRRAAKTEEPVFLVYFMMAHRRPAGTLEVTTIDRVRALLADLGIARVVQDRAVDEVCEVSVTLIRDVELPQEFVDKHGL